MSDKIKKVTISVELNGTAEEEANFMANMKLAKEVIIMATQVGLFDKLPESVKFPTGLFALADFRVIRTEPDTQTSQAE